MVSIWTAVFIAIIAAGLGILAMAMCAVGGQTDEWHDGYQAGYKDGKQ